MATGGVLARQQAEPAANWRPLSNCLALQRLLPGRRSDRTDARDLVQPPAPSASGAPPPRAPVTGEDLLIQFADALMRSAKARRVRLGIAFSAPSTDPIVRAAGNAPWAARSRTRPARALALLERSLSIDPNSPRAWNATATIHCFLGDSETARSHAAHAIRISPRNPTHWVAYTHIAEANLQDMRYQDPSHSLASPRRVPKERVEMLNSWLLLWRHPLRGWRHVLSQDKLPLLNLPSHYGRPFVAWFSVPRSEFRLVKARRLNSGQPQRECEPSALAAAPS